MKEVDRQLVLELAHHLADLPEAPDSADVLALPLRLLQTVAVMIAEIYQPAMWERLGDAEAELLLLRLMQGIQTTSASLKSAVLAMPDVRLPQLHLRAQAQSQALAQVTKLREELFRVVLELGENAEELARQEHELAELETQRQRLLSLQSRLAAADLSLLRRQVADLANSLGPAQDELAQLEIALTQQETLHTELQQAIAVARNILQSNRQDIATSLSRLTELATAWRRRSVTLNERYTAQAAQVVEEIEEAVAEEIRLKQELTAQWAKSDAFASNISELSDSLRFYAENGRRIAVSIPATFETTRERLKEVEGVLALIDDDLKKALTRHQRAGDLLEKIT